MSKAATLVAMLAAACLARETAGQTAVVTTSVNNGAAVTIEPGGTVSISVRIAHNLAAVAGIEGGTVIDGNAGVGSNFATTIPNLPTVSMGSFVGGSRLGASIAFTPGGFGSFTPPSGTNPMPVWTYSVTLAQPGVYDVVWVPTAANPNVRLYASLASFTWTEAQTTYVGARITVTPGVGTASVGVWAASLAIGRRRRGGSL